MSSNPAKDVAISSARKRRPMPFEAPSREQRASLHGRGMRVRVLSLIILITAWLAPANGGACPSDARGASDQTHPATHEAGGHEHGDAHHASGTPHSHATQAESETPGSHAPADGPHCCRSEPRAAVLTASLPADGTQRAKSLLLEAPAPATFDSLAAPARSRFLLPGRQPPPPEPFARTRRPLLI